MKHSLLLEEVRNVVTTSFPDGLLYKRFWEYVISWDVHKTPFIKKNCGRPRFPTACPLRRKFAEGKVQYEGRFGVWVPQSKGLFGSPQPPQPHTGDKLLRLRGPHLLWGHFYEADQWIDPC